MFSQQTNGESPHSVWIRETLTVSRKTMSANACPDWLIKPLWSWVKSLPYTSRNSECSQCKWAAWAVIHPLAQGCQALSEPGSVWRWHTAAPGRCRRAAEAPATEGGGFLFYLPAEKQVFFDLEEGKAKKDRLLFFSSGIDCFETIGNKWCNERQLFPHTWVHCCYCKSSYLWFQFAVTSLGHSFTI